MKQLLKIAKKITILVLAISLFGCTDDNAVLPKVVAGFTFTLNADTGTVTFINISENGNTYNWDFGDESISTEINPVKTYPNGTYTITLKAKNSSGASDTFSDDITILIPEKATLPITFDGANTKYDAEVFAGASFEVVDNPDLSGTNTSASKVGAVTNIGAQYEGFYFDLGSDIDLTTNKSISMNFWSDTPINVLVKLEEGTGAALEATASHGGTGWETIIFNFNSSNNYSRLTIFVDGPGTTAGTFYIDDIKQIETPPSPCTEETTESISAADFNITFMSDNLSVIEDGASFERISNPDFDNDVNSSCFVGKITKLGNNPWDNNQIDLDAKLDFNTHTGLKIKVWSSVPNSEVRIKLEEIGNAPNNLEKFTTTTVTSGWEEITFPYTSSDSNKFNKIVIFFDLNANNTDTYYFDDLMLYGTGSGGGGGGGSFDDGLLTNGDFESGATEWIGNAFNVQTEGGNSFNLANVTAAGNPFDVNLSQVVTITQGKNYRLTFEASSDRSRTMLAGIGLNQDPWTNTTQTVNLTTTTQTFTFDLSSATFGGANSRVLFDMGADIGIVVIDNVSLFCLDCDGGGGGSCPAPPAGDFIVDGDFEANAGCWELIDNGGIVTISTTISNGGSNSGQIKTAPTKNPALKQTRFGVGSIQPNTTYVVKFDIKSSSPLVDGAVFQAFTFSEPADGSGLPAAQHILVAGDPNVTATWVTRNYEFTTAANVDGGLSLLFELVCGGAGTCDGTINIDNVSLKLK